MYTLPKGKSIDMDQLGLAMEDSDLGSRYFLNPGTGELAFFSDFLGLTEEDVHLLDEIDGSDDSASAPTFSQPNSCPYTRGI